MEQELRDLLARLGDEQNPLTDEELANLRASIMTIVGEIDQAAPSEDDLLVLEEAAENLELVNGEIAARTEAADARSARAAELLARINPEQASTEGEQTEGEGEGSEETAAEGSAEGAGEETPAAETTATEGDPPAEGTPAAEPVAAAATTPPPAPPAPRLPSITHLAHRSPRNTRPVPTATRNGGQRAVLLASADMPGIGAGQECDVEQFAQASVRKFEAVRKVRGGDNDGEKVYFGTIKAPELPDSRMLTDNEYDNQEKLEAITSREALVASGGICAPVAVDYSLTTITQAGRPTDEALTTFGAARGGVRFILPHTLAQVTVDAPAALWTAANDANPTSPTTKPHAVFTCQPVQEVFVDAVTSITQFGNFQARYFAEQIAQYLETVDAVTARLAEATLLGAMITGSTAVSAESDLLGAARDLLAAVDRAVAAYRYRHRMAPESPLRFVYPEWLEDMVRADLARQLPGDSGGGAERLAVADAQIDDFFRVRNVNVTTVQDSPTGASVFQGWGTQGVGPLQGWPERVITWLYHEGAWTKLDGGEINLGMVRDSILNRTNDFQFFSEFMEKAVFRGHESMCITFDIAPTGMSAGTADTSVLRASGS